MTTKEETKKLTCTNCGSNIEYADYCIGLQRGVIGGNGFVPTHLDDWMLFCDTNCGADYLGDRDERETPRPKLPPRVP